MDTATGSWSAAHAAHFARLLAGGDAGLDGGAEFVVRNPDGTEAFLAPLARHWRVDAGSTPVRTCLWIRPVVGGYTPDPRRPGDPPYAFDLSEARRRNLTFTACRRDGDTLAFDLEVGQRAWVRPIRGGLLAELQRWDSWYYLHLTAEQQARLDALDADSA